MGWGDLDFPQFWKYFIYFAVQNYFSPVFCWKGVIFHWLKPLNKTECILYNWLTEYNFGFKQQRHVNGDSILSKLKHRDCSVTATSQFYSRVIYSNLTSWRKFKWKQDNKYAGLFKSFYVHVRYTHVCRGMSFLCSFLQCVIQKKIQTDRQTDTSYDVNYSGHWQLGCHISSEIKRESNTK